ncbi:MAG: nucleotidyltransferase, partial [bacterium]
SIIERTRIARDSGVVSVALDDGTTGRLTGDERVSMNMWGFTPMIFEQLKAEFASFIRNSGHDPAAEFYLPAAIGNLMQAGQATVRVLETGAKCFGITFPEDKAAVVESVKKLIGDGVYPGNVRF